MNFDDGEEDELDCAGNQTGGSNNFVGRIMAGSTSSTEGVVSPGKDYDSNQI